MREKLHRGLAKLNIEYTSDQLDKIDQFYEYLVKKNEVMNLTRITDKEEFYVKHILDSLLITKFVDLNNQYILDLGTGAGFPGVPLKIFFPDTDMILIDSVNKKLSFINDVIKALGLKKIRTVHGRAEQLGQDLDFREKFDIVVSRAVADLSVLSELCIPFAKKNGIFIAYKSYDIRNEIAASSYAIKITSGSVAEVHDILIPDTDIKRKIILINKKRATPKQFPRKAGVPSKNPLVDIGST